MATQPATVAKASPDVVSQYGFPMMMFSSAISGAAQLVAAADQSKALKMQADWQRFLASETIELGKQQADRAIERGEFQARTLRAATERAIGGARASFAGQGVSVNSGSALATQERIAKFSEIDSLTIRNNAALEAWGYKVGSQQQAGQSRFNALGSEAEARSTMLSGGARAASEFVRGTRDASTYFSRGS